MKRIAIRIIDGPFLKATKSYAMQSLLAIIALALILHIVDFLTRGAILASLGIATHEWMF